MAIPWAVQRRSRYSGMLCEHHLLLQVTRPAHPNADGGAEDAAYAFQESAFDHLRGWFDQWVLPRSCRRRVFFLRDADADGDLDGSLDR